MDREFKTILGWLIVLLVVVVATAGILLNHDSVMSKETSCRALAPRHLYSRCVAEGRSFFSPEAFEKRQRELGR